MTFNTAGTIVIIIGIKMEFKKKTTTKKQPDLLNEMMFCDQKYL